MVKILFSMAHSYFYSLTFDNAILSNAYDVCYHIFLKSHSTWVEVWGKWAGWELNGIEICKNLSRKLGQVHGFDMPCVSIDFPW